MNHSFEPNAEFVLFSGHPVLGTIMSLAALEDLAPDQEVVLYIRIAEPEPPGAATFRAALEPEPIFL